MTDIVILILFSITVVIGSDVVRNVSSHEARDTILLLLVATLTCIALVTRL